MMLISRDTAPAPCSDLLGRASSNDRRTPSDGAARASWASAPTPRWLEEHRVRHEIDRAVGRALVDPLFAAHLLAEPALALEAEGRGQAEYLAMRAIRAQDLGDFARQVFDEFWSPAHGAQL